MLRYSVAVFKLDIPPPPQILIHNMEQGTPEWDLIRAGIPTASEFSRMVDSMGRPSASRKDYAALLAAEKYAGKPLESFAGTMDTRRGTMLEPSARALYEMLTGEEVEQVGFITDADKRYGCSPDGLIGNEGMLEIKCLKTENHVKTLMNYREKKTCPTTYIPQTQGQLKVTGRLWDDLMFYHPELPPLIIRQHRNQSVIDGITEGIEYVITERDWFLAILREY